MTADPYSAPHGARQHGRRFRPEFFEGVAMSRGVAWILDMAAIALVCAVLLPFTAFTGVFFFPLMMLVVGFLYRWTTISGGSATWGMRAVGIELRDRDGRKLTSGTAFAHTLGYTISIAFPPLQFISIALMALTPRGQGLTDLALGTMAINRPLN